MTDSDPAPQEPSPGASGRLVALDAFRGATILGMILVNNPGSWGHIYGPLQHAEWHGCTPTDLVFPFFLFIVGVAIPLAYGKRMANGVARGGLLAKAVKRGAVLWGLGLSLSILGHLIAVEDGVPAIGEVAWGRLRIPGVLARIGVCYALASVCFLYLRPRAQWLLGAILLLVYWPLMTLVPVPGVELSVGASYLDGPGTHLGTYVDPLVIGRSHLWSQTGGRYGYDPEGVLSTIPALVTCLLGVWTGAALVRWRKAALPGYLVAGRLMLPGALLTALGLVLGQLFPINKQLWTSSYVLYTGGWALVILGLCVLLFDHLRWRRLAKPFLIYGVNAITVFCGSAIVARMLARWVRMDSEDGGTVGFNSWLYASFADALPPKLASLAYALLWVVGWLGVLAVMYRYRIILKV